MGQYPIFAITPVAMFKTRVNHSTINPTLFLKGMAKTDSFFIRVEAPIASAFDQTSVDLGAYVDALGKSVLRIHNIEVQYAIGGQPIGSAGFGFASFQLTTQSQSAMVNIADKSLIASGDLTQSTDGTAYTLQSDNLNLGPQRFTNGYLVGVEQCYVGTVCSAAPFAGGNICLVMECTVETLSQSGAMALALSQQ